jgi:hypothetical protein
MVSTVRTDGSHTNIMKRSKTMEREVKTPMNPCFSKTSYQPLGISVDRSMEYRDKLIRQLKKKYGKNGFVTRDEGLGWNEDKEGVRHPFEIYFEYEVFGMTHQVSITKTERNE